MILPVLILLVGVAVLCSPYIATLGTSLYSWHPVCMAVFLFASITSVLTMKTKSIAAISFHAFLQTIALIAITAGFTVIYQNKDNNSKPHFTSYHGIIGATAYSVVTLVAVFGMGILWFPGLVFGSVLKAKKWNQVKEYSGFLALVLSAVAGGIGIYSYASLVEASKYGVLATVIIAMGFAILVPSTYPATKNVKAK